MSDARILIVEDKRVTAKLIQESLQHLGYTIAAIVSSGEEALQKVAEILPDIVLMDIQLRGKMNGIEAADHIRQRHAIPVVYLTDHVDNELLTPAKITAPFGYILKPFEEKELYMVIEIALYRYQMEAKIRQLNDELEQRVEERTAALKEINQARQESLEALHTTLTQLAQAEKMAVLGGLVAGMAHEMSSPLGIGVMAISHLEESYQKIYKQFLTGKLTKSDLEKYFHTTEESVKIVQKNLYRASELLNSFKQIAIDQTSESKREFTLSEYIEEVLLSLKPTLRMTQHQITVDCPSNLVLHSYPGAFSQILTNLIMNSLTHGFENMKKGHIHIQVLADHEHLHLHYKDNGKGIPEEDRKKLFDLFYTTKRSKGNSGIGLNIIYNLVTQRLGGRIMCESTTGQGALFTIQIPAVIVKEP